MTSSSKQKTQNLKKLRIGRKCTKYSFVAPLSFTITVQVSIKNFAAVPTWYSNKNFPSETLLKVQA